MAWSMLHAAFHPVIYINEQLYRGDLEADELKIAICAGFKDFPEPCLPL
jgi:hypothetical protein